MKRLLIFYFVRNGKRAMKSGRVEWVRYVACMVRKPEKKRPRVRSVCVCRWEINVRLCFKELCWEGMEWPCLAQNVGRRRAVVECTS